MAKYQVVIGRAEKIDIVGLTLNVPAKIDSGAYRSSIHCKSIRVQKNEAGDVLKVELLGHPCSPVVYKAEFIDFETVIVTNSFGHEETRYEVKLKVKVGPKKFTTSFTLADRANNLFPILVGRKLLKNKFIIDVARTGIDRIKLKQDFGITAPIDEEDLED